MIDPAPRLDRRAIASRVAQELPDGAVVNLGIGIPTMCSDFVPGGVQIIYQAETGMLGCGRIAADGDGNPDIMNAGGQFLEPVPGMSFFDSVEAFNMIRGGHIDITVLGALQVAENGDLANWLIPSRGIGSIGGAMDLAVGAKKVIVAMEHTDRRGNPKIVETCAYPLTGEACVTQIVTDIAVIDVAPGGGLVLREVAPGWSAEAVQALTAARLQVPSTLPAIHGPGDPPRA
ncbi:MAG: 3-oxoacid CoA-transferase subunit B [Dehalococcoidia bacterium]